MQVQSVDKSIMSVQSIRKPVEQDQPVEPVKLEQVKIEPVKEIEIDNSMIEQNLEDIDANIQETIDMIKQQIQDAGFNVHLRMDDRIDGFIASIVDKETGQVIKELPPEEIIKLRASINEKIKGILFDEEG
ncbi:MAG: hypothetical protein A2Y40_02050 [Candidatus Margulisbacteria bacterium GWF2_35_9]|nr:MAG: hypothetical protein A2Y40_02050 [Candidatus Margulisbacteria bacterium GWF2_35_9]